MAQKRIFISDVHLGAGKFASSHYKNDWDWLSVDETQNFVSFLNHLETQQKDQIKEIVLLGDIFDNWICPHDIRPPSIDEIINAEKNTAVKDALLSLSSAIKVLYLPGNHDMHATKNVIKNNFPDIIYCPQQYTSGRIHAEHGHRYALFNSPPFYSDHYHGLPLGYFIARMEATRKAATGDGNRNYKTYVDDALEVFGKSTLSQCVFEAVQEESNLADNVQFVMNENFLPLPASDVKERYRNIYEDWPNRVVSKPRAVFAELDMLGPIADRLCKMNGYKVCIFGHSHHAEVDRNTWFVEDRIYANSGYWCGSDCTFIEVEKENEKYTVHLNQWKNQQIESITSTSVE
ncbi:MAG: metallophosphoesterase [Deltaproteobacteria bacterium]|nr:metallophosphoesterase [Deltaproteobacteria bacterium]